MPTTDELTDLGALASLRACVCPACGGAKVRGQTLCRADYFRLPAEARKNLYRRVGEGYREALIAALGVLNVDQPVLPAPRS